MQHPIRNLTLTILAALALSRGLFAQTARPSGVTTAQPDLSGIWQEDRVPGGVPSGLFTKEEPPMFPWAIERSRIRNRGTIAFWDGDTLVVDVVNIDPETWLDGDGTFHDENLHVIERLTRKGNTLEYDVTIEDPTLFTGSWKPVLTNPGGGVLGRLGSTTRLLRQPEEHAIPDYPCVERDREHKVNNDRF